MILILLDSLHLNSDNVFASATDIYFIVYENAATSFSCVQATIRL